MFYLMFHLIVAVVEFVAVVVVVGVVVVVYC